MSIKKTLAIALAPYLPVFGAIFGVTLLGVSTYYGNVTMFFLSIAITSVLPPTLEAVGRSLKEKYGETQNEIDMIAMIPEWSLGLEMLAGIAIIVVSAVLKNIAVCYLGLWLLLLGNSLTMAKEINGLKEDLRSPDLEKRRAAIEKVELYERLAGMLGTFLLIFGSVLWILLLEAGVVGVAPDVTEGELLMILLLALLSPIQVGVVAFQADKVKPPEPEKAARAAS